MCSHLKSTIIVTKVKSPDDKKLDNPVWHSLSEAHQGFSIDYGNIKFYHPDYCPFGGFEIAKGISHSVDEYAGLTGNFFMVGEKPELSNQLKLKKELVCFQMVIHERIAMETGEDITRLTQEHADGLYQLVNLVQPGYFKTKTALLGNYFGIFKNNELIAVTGERMTMDAFVEVSAVITRPGHTGKGYAKQLVAHTVNNIFERDRNPYLHVAEDNTAAIRLYEKLGFEKRREISFWNITR